MATTSLLTDHYELTMLQAALASGTAHRRCTFEVFTRRLPAGRRYGVLAGTGRFLEGLQSFRFDDEDLSFLASRNVVNAQTLKYLENFRFTGNIRGYVEGEIFFPHSPVVQVEATFAEACVLETYLLSILNYDSAVASAASRMTAAAGHRPVPLLLQASLQHLTWKRAGAMGFTLSVPVPTPLPFFTTLSVKPLKRNCNR